VVAIGSSSIAEASRVGDKQGIRWREHQGNSTGNPHAV